MSADRIVLLRHGRTGWNLEGRFQGQTDIGLDDVGLAEAGAAAVALAELVGPGPVRIVSSDLVRCTATGQPLADRLGLPLETDRALRERDIGSWEGLLRADVERLYPQELASWLSGQDLPLGGGESIAETGARAEGSVTRHAATMDGGTLVVVSHGAAIRGALGLLLGSPAGNGVRFEVLRNAHWATLAARRGSWALSAYNVGAPAGRPELESSDAGRIVSPSR